MTKIVASPVYAVRITVVGGLLVGVLAPDVWPAALLARLVARA